MSMPSDPTGTIARVSRVVARRSAGVSPAVDPGLVARYFGESSPRDLDARDPEDLAAVCIAHWRAAAQRPPGTAVARVIHPDLERDGWRSVHSVVLIVTDDMPFLVDSVRMLLDRHGLAVHLMVHPMLAVERDDGGRLTGLAERGGVVEAWTMIEIDRCDEALGAQLEADLHRVLDDVRTAVTDWGAMRTRTQQLAQDLSADSSAPVSKLLNWLSRRRFVFLAMGTFALGEGGLEFVDGTGLGLLRHPQPLDPPMAMHQRLLSVSRTDALCTVHRPTRMTCIAVRTYAPDGSVRGEERIIGLFAEAAYRETVTETPYLSQRAESVISGSGFAADSHSGRAVRAALESFPRNDLFEIDPAELYDVVLGIAGMQDRPQVRAFAYTEPTGRYLNLLVYLPRSRFTEHLADEVAWAVGGAVGGTTIEHDTSVGDSALARIRVVVRTNGTAVVPSLGEVEALVDRLTTSWTDRFEAEVIAALGAQPGRALLAQVGGAVPADFQAVADPRAAVLDLRRAVELGAGGEVRAALGRRVGDPEGQLRLKVYRHGDQVALSELVPLLEHLGLAVLDEHPFQFRLATGSVWLHDIGVRALSGVEPSSEVKAEIESSFLALFRGEIEADGFNRLVLAAGLSARQVAVIRAYAKYLRQTSFPYSQPTIENALAGHPELVRELVRLFESRFDPALGDDRETHVAASAARVEALLDEIPSLDDDRIGRAVYAVIQATLRTNAYRPVGDVVDGPNRPVLSFKFDPALVPELPAPRPAFEIWVCSPRVEGVHLRGGSVARGGLRWSDRKEDFRTEVLGLMKAQMVKNAVIVPVGAKGGFVVKRQVEGDALRAEVVECYRMFVSGMLDLTDNVVGHDVVPPPRTVRYDGDDPYLVVAADKGTATFSDIANDVSAQYGFWLGDAFASGGSAGYDHKAMGITARGAWESVRRHARTIGRDADNDPMTIVGIGDMSGDVFGNGLLRSPHVRLIAAFDHRHVFIDPNPDAEAGFVERLRLFQLPRSSWADYDASLISRGGGVWPRSAKLIHLSPEAMTALGIESSALTPVALINRILQAPVDILWNGGIGTYVKASTETHLDCGDRANDAVRIDATELRCRIVGEGGNLGFTQRARVEYARAGGLIYTDAIDNSAGVDCSDHEVNIKILLNDLVSRGDLTRKRRDALLVEMTDEVAELVLDDNRAQTLALAVARVQSGPMVNVHARYIQQLEIEGWLNRQLEFLPTDKQIAERQALGQGLATPELAVLLAYTKMANVHEIEDSTDLAADPYLEPELLRYFPAPLRERYADEIRAHRLRDDIVLTQVVNQMVNTSGISFDHRMTEETGASVADVVRAWVATRDIFDAAGCWERIASLPPEIPFGTQVGLLLELRRMVERSVMWLLRHRRPPLDIAATVEQFHDAAARLLEALPPLVRGPLGAQIDAHTTERLVTGLPADLAEHSATWPVMHTTFDVIELAHARSLPAEEVAASYWELFETLDVFWLWDAIGRLPRADRWQTHARAAVRDDLMSALADLTAAVVDHGGSAAAWAAANERALRRAQDVFAEIRRLGTFDLTTVSVALRQLRNLVLSTATVPVDHEG